MIIRATFCIQVLYTVYSVNVITFGSILYDSTSQT